MPPSAREFRRERLGKMTATELVHVRNSCNAELSHRRTARGGGVGKEEDVQKILVEEALALYSQRNAQDAERERAGFLRIARLAITHTAVPTAEEGGEMSGG